MIEAAPLSQFLHFNIGLWIFCFIYNQWSDQCKLECYNYQKKIILFFNKLPLILIYLLDPK